MHDISNYFGFSYTLRFFPLFIKYEDKKYFKISKF